VALTFRAAGNARCGADAGGLILGLVCGSVFFAPGRFSAGIAAGGAHFGSLPGHGSGNSARTVATFGGLRGTHLGGLRARKRVGFVARDAVGGPYL